jgi:hypothetical protein
LSAADLTGELAGSVSLVWDDNDRAPESAELAGLMALGVRVGGQIAAVLDLCHHLSARLPLQIAE